MFDYEHYVMSILFMGIKHYIIFIVGAKQYVVFLKFKKLNYETDLAPDGALRPYNCGPFSILIYLFDHQMSNTAL